MPALSNMCHLIRWVTIIKSHFKYEKDGAGFISELDFYAMRACKNAWVLTPRTGVRLLYLFRAWGLLLFGFL